jgi:hypothetical protein
MDYDRFITIVERATGVSREAAERATRATLQTLADRISKEEALDLVEELSPELAPAMFTDGPAEGFDVDEFIRRVAERGLLAFGLPNLVGCRPHLRGAHCGDEPHAVLVADDDVLGRHLVRPESRAGQCLGPPLIQPHRARRVAAVAEDR